MSCQELNLPKNNIAHSDVVQRNIVHFLPRIVSNQVPMFKGTYNNFPTGLEYLAREDGSVALVHTIQI